MPEGLTLKCLLNFPSPFDWRWGYIYLGLAVMMVTAPVALLIPGRQAQADGGTRTPGRAQTTSAPLEVSITAAATAFGLLSVCSAVGALISGLASDRVGRKNMLALAYLIRCGAFAVLLF